jgi:hypothetical protein
LYHGIEYSVVVVFLVVVAVVVVVVAVVVVDSEIKIGRNYKLKTN